MLVQRKVMNSYLFVVLAIVSSFVAECTAWILVTRRGKTMLKILSMCKVRLDESRSRKRQHLGDWFQAADL